MTELEAVNTLLGIIGEAPIDRLADVSVNDIDDSSLARKTLSEVERDVQSEGWGWNTDYGVELQKEVGTNQFPLPTNQLKVFFSPSRYPSQQYVARGNRVYDRVKRTYDFGDDFAGPLIADQVVTRLEWDEMPHQAQQYATIRAARIYSDRYVNSNVIYTYTVQDEEYARAMLIRAEESQLGNNLLWGNDRGSAHGLSYFPAEGTRFRTR